MSSSSATAPAKTAPVKTVKAAPAAKSASVAKGVSVTSRRRAAAPAAVTPAPVIVPATAAAAPVYPPLKTTAADDRAGLIRGMEEDGYVVIPGVLNAAEVAECKRRIDDLRPFCYDRHDPEKKQIDHYKNVFNRSPYWLQYLDKPGIIDAAEGVMGDDCHIIGQTGWRTPPGAGGFGMHIDQQFFPVHEDLIASGQVKLPVMLSTAHFYLNDMTLDLCPTWVVPGSHKSGRGPGAKPGESRYGFIGGQENEWNGQPMVPVLLKAGDVMLFRSEIWHSGSKNETADQTRYLLQVHYGRRMMAQKFSPYLDFHFNAEVVASATPRQLRLMGKHTPGAYD